MIPNGISPVQLAVLLSMLPDDDPLVVASRLALEMRHDLRLNLDDYCGGRWHREHLLPEFTELQRRRWPPTGDRDLWVRYGPAGPPLALAEPAVAA